MALPVFAGTPAPVTPPPPPSEQGFTLGLEALYLRSYQSNGQYDTGDWDFGGRGSLGYQFGDGLFVKATYFGYGSDVQGYIAEGKNGEYTINSAELDVSYIDLVVGQNFKPTENLKLSPYVGLRWGTFEESATSVKYYSDGDFKEGERRGNDFSGLGIVLGIDMTRSLGNNFSLYGVAKQSVLFGESDNTDIKYKVDTDPDNKSYSDDRVVYITELGLGLQYDFCFNNVVGNVRLGVEAQYWGGLSSEKVDGKESNANTGLAGFVIGANFRF